MMGVHVVGQGLKMIIFIFAGCGAKWHCMCVLGAFPLDLLFWYCGNCCTLDACDPAMNVTLQILLTVYDIDAVVMEVGYEAYKQVATYKGSFVIIEGHLYRLFSEGLKEVV